MYSYMGFIPDDDENTKPLKFVMLDAVLKEHALFYTVTYTIVVRVGNATFLESDEVTSKPSMLHVNAWVRGVIMQHRHALRALDVDVESAYERFGGDRYDMAWGW